MVFPLVNLVLNTQGKGHFAQQCIENHGKSEREKECTCICSYDCVVCHWVISSRFIWRRSVLFFFFALTHVISNCFECCAQKRLWNIYAVLHLSEQIKPFSIDLRGTIKAYIACTPPYWLLLLWHTTKGFVVQSVPHTEASHTHSDARNKAANRKMVMFIQLVSLSHPATLTIKQWQWRT